jgi:hypothetical protein
MAVKNFYPSKEAIVASGQTIVSEAANKGAGRDYHLSAGNIALGGTATNNDVRSLIQFTMDFSDVNNITSAVLKLTTARATDGVVADYTRAAHGTFASGTTYVRQLIGAWNAGVRGNDETWYTDNAVTWANKPNNNGTTNRFSISNQATRPTDPTLVSVDITSLVSEWRSGTVNYGIELVSSSEAGTGFQEYYSSHAQSDGYIAGAIGPYIELTYTAVAAVSRPVVTAISPKSSNVAKIANLNEGGSEWAATSYSASPQIDWSITKSSNGSAISNWRLRIWEGATATGTQVFESGTVSAEPYLSYRSVSLGSEKPSWMPGAGWLVAGKSGLLNGGTYAWGLVANDTAGSAGSVSATPFKVRWAQAVYEFDASSNWSQTSQWTVTPNVPEKNTSIGIAYRALSVSGGLNSSASLVYAKGTSASMTYYLSSKNASVTGVSSATGSLVTYDGTNTFTVGDYINISGISTSVQYNLSNVNVTAATGTTFTVASTATGSYVHSGNNRPYAYSSHPFNASQRMNVTGITTSAGTNTYNVSSAIIGSVSANTSGTVTAISNPVVGTVRYTASNTFAIGDKITIYGVNPVAYNLANATVTFADPTYFEVSDATTTAYVASSGRAQALTASVNLPGSATYSSGGTASIAWSASVSDTIASGRYLNAAVRLSSDDGVNQPYLSSLEFVYATSIQSPDNWYATNGAALLDSSVRRFGTKSAKFTGANTSLITETANITGATGDGTAITFTSNHYYSVGNVVTTTSVDPVGYNVSGVTILSVTPTTFTVAGTAVADYVNGGIVSRSQYDGYLAAGDAYAISADVSVVQNTIYTLAAYVKPNVITSGNEIRVRVYEGGPSLGAILADSGAHTDTTRYTVDNEGWYRLTATFNTGTGRSSVRPVIYLVNNAGVDANSFWSDGASLEEGSVVRSWTPGFVTTAITFEGGGMNIDAYGGGSLRLRGADGGQRDVIELGNNGLLLGGAINPVEIYSDTDSSLIVNGSVAAQNISAAGTVNIGLDTSLYRQTADKLATADTFVLTGGTVEFGASNDVNLYRYAGDYLKTDDVFFPANIAAGVYTGNWSIEDTWSVTGLSVLSSAGGSGGTANFSIMITPWRTGSAQTTNDQWTFAIRPVDTTFTSGRLTGFTLYTAELSQYEPNGFYWMVIGI